MENTDTNLINSLRQSYAALRKLDIAEVGELEILDKGYSACDDNGRWLTADGGVTEEACWMHIYDEPLIYGEEPCGYLTPTDLVYFVSVFEIGADAPEMPCEVVLSL